MGADGAASTTEAVQEERRAAQEVRELDPRQGFGYFLVWGDWIAEWQLYVSTGEGRPGRIDNAALLSDTAEACDDSDYSPALATLLLEGIDYVLVSESVWQKLVSWYGGGPAIRREAVPTYCGVCVETHPLPVTVKLRQTRGHHAVVNLRVGYQRSVADLIALACQHLQIEDDPATMCLREECLGRVEVKSLERSALVGDAVASMATLLLLREQAETEAGRNIEAATSSTLRMPTGTDMDISSPASSAGDNVPDEPGSPQRTPRDVNPPVSALLQLAGHSHANNSPEPPSDVDLDSGCPAGPGVQPGECGLVNLGNTCFMAAGLQCLAHADALMGFFATEIDAGQKRYIADLNRHNPLGSQGRLAEAYATLSDKIHSGQWASFAPRSFKRAIEEIAPQFAGFEQHDSQEFLNFLLDGLHEDLNRCLVKPQTQAPQVSNEDDLDQVARQAWAVHRQRNDSIIVDTIQGQYKSTVTCPMRDCNKVSITFDPFMILSIPLPAATKTVTLTFVWKSGGQSPINMTIQCTSVEQLRAKIAADVHVDADKLVLVEVFQGKVFRSLRSTGPIGSIHQHDKMAVYEMTCSVPDSWASGADEHDRGDDQATDRELTKISVVQVVGNGHLDARPNICGNPLLLVEHKQNFRVCDLFLHIDKHMQRILGVSIAAWRERALSDNGEDLLRCSKRSKHTDSSAMSTADSLAQTELLGSTVNREAYSGPYTVYARVPSEREHYQALQRNSTEQLTEFDSQQIVVAWDSSFAEKYGIADAGQTDEGPADVLRNPVSKTKEQDVHAKIQLHRCLDKMLEREQLEESNSWYCGSCKEHRRAWKQLELWNMPEMLILHLKRFSFSSVARDKVDEEVFFPLENLDMARHMCPRRAAAQSVPPVYDLFAVVNHYGFLGGGHYTAYVKHQDKWLHFDGEFIYNSTHLLCDSQMVCLGLKAL